MHNDYKFLAMAIGVFSTYTESRDYLANYRAHLLATFAQMNLRAVRNGFFHNRLDELFVRHAIDKIEDVTLQNIPVLDAEDDAMVMLYMMKFSKHITVKFIIELLKSKGYTRSDIAEHIGVSLPTVQRWASGQDIKDEDTIRQLIDMYLDTEMPQKEDTTE